MVTTHLNIQVPDVIEQFCIVHGHVVKGLLQNGVAIISRLSINPPPQEIVVERRVEIPEPTAVSIQEDQSLNGGIPYHLILENIGKANRRCT